MSTREKERERKIEGGRETERDGERDSGRESIMNDLHCTCDTIFYMNCRANKVRILGGPV